MQHSVFYLVHFLALCNTEHSRLEYACRMFFLGADMFTKISKFEIICEILVNDIAF